MGYCFIKMDCALCRIKESFQVIKTTAHAVACVNFEPFADGHIMVLPKEHYRSYAELRSEEAKDLFDLLQEMSLVLRKVYKVEATITLANHGKNQSQEHIHIHLIPSWDEEGARNIVTLFYKRPLRLRGAQKELEAVRDKIKEGLV